MLSDMDKQVDQLLLKIHEGDLASNKREQVIRELVHAATTRFHETHNEEEILDDALDREQVESTYIGLGLAVPHARVHGLQRAGIYVATSRDGIPWPTEEAHLITLLIVPWENPEVHLQLLSRIVRWRKSLTEAELCALAESPEKLEATLSTELEV